MHSLAGWRPPALPSGRCSPSRSRRRQRSVIPIPSHSRRLAHCDSRAEPARQDQPRRVTVPCRTVRLRVRDSESESSVIRVRRRHSDGGGVTDAGVTVTVSRWLSAVRGPSESRVTVSVRGRRSPTLPVVAADSPAAALTGSLADWQTRSQRSVPELVRVIHCGPGPGRAEPESSRCRSNGHGESLRPGQAQAT